MELSRERARQIKYCTKMSEMRVYIIMVVWCWWMLYDFLKVLLLKRALPGVQIRSQITTAFYVC